MMPDLLRLDESLIPFVDVTIADVCKTRRLFTVGELAREIICHSNGI